MKRLAPILLILAFAACRQVPVVEVETTAGDTLAEHNATANRYLAQSEETQIEAYIQRRGWKMQRLTGGTRVMETSAASGQKIDYEDTVVVEYDIETIGGQAVYRGVTDTVVAGRLEPTRGLDAAIRTLRHGSEAVVIVPSGQAYGVLGDGDRVSTRLILVYKLKVK